MRDLQHLESADAGQVDLEQHEVHVFLLHHLQRGFSRRGSQHAVVAPQGSSQCFAHLLVAVDDEQCLPSVWHGNGEYIMGRESFVEGMILPDPFKDSIRNRSMSW